MRILEGASPTKLLHNKFAHTGNLLFRVVGARIALVVFLNDVINACIRQRFHDVFIQLRAMTVLQHTGIFCKADKNGCCA